VVKECNRLGIVVDTAHGTFDMVKGVVKASSKPILLSHTALSGSKAQGTFWAENFRGGLPTMQARQVTPEHAKAVADAGGVVGIWHLFPSVENYVQGMREMVDVVGVDHVGIGMDWSIESINHIWPDQTEGMMYAVIGEMLKQGFTPEECGKIAGGNFCRVFKACV
jgi:membrane dipeptidase